MPKAQTVGSIYELAVALGRAADPRGPKQVATVLRQEKTAFEKLTKEKQQYFDHERLTNPYPDSRILFGSTTTPVKTVLAGIDMDGAELLLADRLRQTGTPIDAVIAHHPEGIALAKLNDQLTLQTDLLANYGVPIHIVESLLDERIAELGRAISPLNHYRAVDVARLLTIPFLCTHTVTDNLVHAFLESHVLGKKPAIVSDIIDALMELPEFETAERQGAGPHIVSGSGHRRTGTIAFTDLTGGTGGAKEMYDFLSKNGVGTIIAMHMREETVKLAKAAHLNVVIAGHMSSDSLGLNLFLDHLEQAGVTIIPAGGLIRISRPISTKKSTTQTRKKGA